MKKFNVLLIIFIFSLSVFSIAEESSKTLNIVLLVSDDHGTNDLGCYGNTIIKTPNLDKLAEDGFRFTNAYATSASCTASRSVILSGIYNHANGLFGHSHHFHHFRAYDHIKSLPVLLEELAGYRTARIGKYHVAPESVFRFQTVLPGDSRNPVEMSNNCKEFLFQESDDPFFLYYCTSDPHRGGGVVEKNKYKPDRFGNLEEGYDGVEETFYSPDEVEVPPYLPDTPECRAELAQYYQSVSRMDQGIGVLFEHIKNSGKWNNTVIIYISDNGIAFPGAKTNIYQPGINLPCIIRYPLQSEKNKIIEAKINWSDLTPTLLDIARILPEAEQILRKQYDLNKQNWDNTVNKSFHGRSFKSILDGNPIGDWNETYASHTFHEITMYYPMRTVIYDNYKLIWNIAYLLPYPQSTDLWASSTWQGIISSNEEYYAGRKVKAYINRDKFELYELSNDPYEVNNLAKDKEYSDIIKVMILKLKDFQARTNDPWISKWEYE